MKMNGMFVIALIFFALSLFTASAYGSCPNGWIRHDTACYHFSHDTESMLVANLACQQMDGSLVEIGSSAENTYLEGYIKDKYDYYWIGLSDIQEERSWIWMGSKERAVYLNWRSGEPNNVGNDENCAVIGRGNNGAWIDVHCRGFYHYICEKKDTESEIVG